MARAMKLSNFFDAHLDENYRRATEAIRPEEVKAFSERETGVRKDHCHGKPNSSLAAFSDKSRDAACGFLLSQEEEYHFFFNKFRRLSRLYKQLRNK